MWDLDISPLLPYGIQTKIARKLNVPLSEVNAVVKGRRFNQEILEELLIYIREEKQKVEDIKNKFIEILK